MSVVDLLNLEGIPEEGIDELPIIYKIDISAQSLWLV